MKSKYRLYIIFYSIFLLGIACKKEHSIENIQPKPTPPPISNTEVLSVGSILENNVNRAAYWVDSNFFYAEPASTERSLALGIEKYGNSIIVVGEAGQYGTGMAGPCYWTSGQKYNLPQPTGIYSTAQDIKIFNNNIYILVSAALDSNSFIWKLNAINATPEIIALQIPNNADIIAAIKTTNMVVANDSLVVFGSYKAKFPDGTTRMQPCVWKINSLNNGAVTVLENDSTKNFSVFWGDAFNQNLYMIGKSEFDDSLYIWSEQGRFITTDIFNIALYGKNKCKINSQTNYLHLFYTIARPSIYAEKIQIIPATKSINKSSVPALPNSTSHVFGMDIHNNEFAYGVVYDNRTTFPSLSGWVYKDAIRIPLKIPNTIQALDPVQLRIFKK